MTRNPQVDAWMDAYDNPQRENVQRVRELILTVDDRITEAIKWKVPTFVFNGNIASFHPKSLAANTPRIDRESASPRS